jgi:hypothetical protein
MKKLVCKLIGHNSTGEKPIDKILMLITTGHMEGCLRCGALL